jgi:alkylation response protein AidB-like acyl-CoA dehydrogenase
MTCSSEDLALLRDSVRQWATDASRGRAPPAADAKASRQCWQELAALGWAGIAIDERYGGSAMGSAAAALVAHELGRELLPTPFLSTAWLAATLVGTEGTAAQRERWLGPMARGELIVAPALGAEADPVPGPATATARRCAGGWTVSGALQFVPDGGAADLLLVAASVEPTQATAATGLFMVPAAQTERSAQHMIDRRDWACCRLDAVEVPTDYRIEAQHSDAGALERLLDHARMGLAAEMVGMAERALELTLDYLRTRVQFGQPIGSFQALQHRVAVAHCELQLAAACGEAVNTAFDSRAADRAPLAALAKFMAGKALHLISNEMIQLHGGIGMTAEHPAGRYLKRARIAETLYGNAPSLMKRYACLKGF